jgi:hypothetical protein
MTYRVYLITWLDVRRNYTSIFVETEDDLTGETFHVSTDDDLGVYVEHLLSGRPEEAETFLYKSYVGRVSVANYPRMQSIVRALPASIKLSNRPNDIYPGIPLGQCSDWTEDAIQVLKDEGILEK